LRRIEGISRYSVILIIVSRINHQAIPSLVVRVVSVVAKKVGMSGLALDEEKCEEGGDGEESHLSTTEM